MMTDNADKEENQETKSYSQEELDNIVNGLKVKNAELLGEKKTAFDAASAAETAKQQADDERLKEQGEFKSLYETSQTELTALRDEQSTYKKNIESKDINASALSIAATLTKDPARQAMLVEQIAKNAVYDDGVKFAFGGIELDQAKLVEKIKTDFPFLVDGNPAKGDGVTGSTKGGGAVKTKVNFNEMTTAQKVAHLENK
jgi:hypothetical protein